MSYEEDVKGPGKFEGERRYVPYFWEQYLDGGADKDDGKFLHFKLTDEDKKKFPELKGRKVIKIWEDDVGFVREANPLGRPRRNPHRKSKAGLGILGLVVLAGAGYMLYRIIKGQAQ